MKSKLFTVISLILLVLGSSLATFLTLDAFGLVTIGETESLTIELKDRSKQYDALPLTITLDDIEIKSGSLDQTKYELEITPSRSITEVGTCTCNATFKVLNKENGKDVTKLFNINVEPATLTVSKRELTLECGTTEFEYNGSVLSPSQFNLTLGTLVEGHKLNPVISNITNGLEAGEATCNVKIQVIDRNGYEVSSNYNLTYNTSQAYTIIPRSINFLPTTLSKTYDGNKFQITTYETILGSLANGDTVSLQTETDLINASDNAQSSKIKATFKNSKGDDVTTCYNFVSQEYDFYIYPISYEVQLPIITKVYDGKSIVNELTTAINAINNSISAYGSIELNASTKATLDNFINVKYDSTGKTVESIVLDKSSFITTCDDSNHSLTLKSGSLTITPVELTVKFADLNKTYDGDPFTESEIIDSLVITGIIDKDKDGITVEYSEYFEFKNSTIPTKKDATFKPVSYNVELVAKTGKEDNAGNYKIKYMDGTICINPLNIEIKINNEIKPNVTNKEQFLDDIYTVSNWNDNLGTLNITLSHDTDNGNYINIDVDSVSYDTNQVSEKPDVLTKDNIKNVTYTVKETGSITFKDVITVLIEPNLSKEFDNKKFDLAYLLENNYIEIDEESSISDVELDDLTFTFPQQFKACDKKECTITATYNSDSNVDVVVKSKTGNKIYMEITKKEIVLSTKNDIIKKVYDGKTVTVPTSHIIGDLPQNCKVGEVYANSTDPYAFTASYKTLNITGVKLVNENLVDVTDCFDISFSNTSVRYKIDKRTIYYALIDQEISIASLTDNQANLRFYLLQLVNSQLVDGDYIYSISISISNGGPEMSVTEIENTTPVGDYHYVTSTIIIYGSNESSVSSGNNNSYTITCVYKGTLTLTA